jgi:lipopolysaccharide transport system ATP-binding protein
MAKTVLKVDNISKLYRLGEVGTGTISHDLNRWWAKVRGQEDPFAKIGQTNDRTRKSDSDYVWVLNEINFEVKQGEVLGIIGRNGAGKSTLLKIISQITSPTKGTVKAKGRIASLLEVGTGMNPELTARENIYLNGAILGMRKFEIDRKFDEIIDFSGCQMYVDTPIKRFSSGMRVRLGFAVAAFLEPEILIVDEVLAVGDAEFQKKAIGKMQDVSKGEGRTVLFVSHDMGAIQFLCNSVLLLNKGGVEAIGETEEIINLYLNTGSTKNQSLLEIIGRTGHNKRKFSSVNMSIEYNGELINNVNEIPCGVKVFIDLTIISDFVKNENIEVAMDISDSKGVNLFNLSNQFTNCELFSTGIKTVVRFEISELNLRNGIFYISFWGKDSEGVFDYILRSFSFCVIKTDFFKSGKFPDLSHHGYFLIKNKQYNL